MSVFTFKYGPYTFDTGEVLDFVWEHNAHITKRGQRDLGLYRVTLKGMFLACTAGDWTDIRDDVLAFRNAFSADNDLKFVLVNPDGTDSSYVLDPVADPDIIKGPYLTKLWYPTGTIEEMVAKREFAVTMEVIRLEPESEIIEYTERVTHIGNCQKSWVFQNVLGAVSRSYDTWSHTTQTIIQKGSSVGLEGYYCPGWNTGWGRMGIPIFPNPLLYEHQERRIEIPGKPLHLGRRFVYYPASWTYVYESAQPHILFPT